MVKLNPPNRWSTWDWLKSNLARAPVGKNVCQVESGSSKCMFQHVKTRPGTLGQVATGCVCLLVCIYAIYYILYTRYIYIYYIYIHYIYIYTIYILTKLQRGAPVYEIAKLVRANNSNVTKRGYSRYKYDITIVSIVNSWALLYLLSK